MKTTSLVLHDLQYCKSHILYNNFCQPCYCDYSFLYHMDINLQTLLKLLQSCKSMTMYSKSATEAEPVYLFSYGTETHQLLLLLLAHIDMLSPTRTHYHLMDLLWWTGLQIVAFKHPAHTTCFWPPDESKLNISSLCRSVLIFTNLLLWLWLFFLHQISQSTLFSAWRACFINQIWILVDSDPRFLTSVKPCDLL